MNVELRQSGSGQLIDRLEVDDLVDVPQPGRWFLAAGQSFLVLQRSHRYHYRAGRYQLAVVSLQVKAQDRPADARRWQNQWVIGDPSCRYNARSPLLRCAVLPDGPCERCSHYDGDARISREA
ncbi:MAG: hypothetical protein FJ077_00140 [Cyanobacteria bacterium K_DeepCast_35m_m2_023]|nr:hypothetical protein [Cyanobacteria bacterium K_DeepCast_35m_m2_023]